MNSHSPRNPRTAFSAAAARTPNAALRPSQSDVIKEPPMEIDGRCMTISEFVAYVEQLEFPEPLPDRIFLHHTWKPTRESWRGYSTIMAMKAYYEKQLWIDENGLTHEGWNAGPHLFVADDGIWLFSDLRYDGVGALGHNTGTRHLEMVGDYDAVQPSGATWENTVAALGILHCKLGLDIQRLCFHRDVSYKSCPGWAVQKSWVIPQVAAWIDDYRRMHPASLRDRLTAHLASHGKLVPTNPNAALATSGVARGLLGAISDEMPISLDGQMHIVQFFAEALIVPQDRWDEVRSLREIEQGDQPPVVGPRPPKPPRPCPAPTTPPREALAPDEQTDQADAAADEATASRP